MWPSKRITRFVIIYAVLLFLLDHFLINPSRGWLESLLFVSGAALIVLLVYPLFKKGYLKLFGGGKEREK